MLHSTLPAPRLIRHRHVAAPPPTAHRVNDTSASLSLPSFSCSTAALWYAMASTLAEASAWREAPGAASWRTRDVRPSCRWHGWVGGWTE